MHESTMIQSPKPRCTATHSPLPGPNIEISKTSAAGGSINIVLEGLQSLACPVTGDSQLLFRPLSYTPEPQRRGLRFVSTSFRYRSYGEIYDVTGLNNFIVRSQQVRVEVRQ